MVIRCALPGLPGGTWQIVTLPTPRPPSSWASAGAAASIRATSPITDASNIIFFIYSSLFRSLVFMLLDSTRTGQFLGPSDSRPKDYVSLIGLPPLPGLPSPSLWNGVGGGPHRASARGPSGVAHRTH